MKNSQLALNLKYKMKTKTTLQKNYKGYFKNAIAY